MDEKKENSILDKASKFKNEHKKGLTIALVIIVCVCFLGVLLTNKKQVQESIITVLDVGKGECIFIKSGNEYAIYDAGYDESHKTAIDDFIRTYEVSNIKALILSHNDKYNINGAVSLLKNYDVDNLYMSEFGGNSKAYDQLLDYIDKANIKVNYPKQGDKIILFDGTITFIQPDNIQFVDNDDASLCIQYQDSRYNRTYMTGGASSVVEKEILKYVKKLDKKIDEQDNFYSSKYLILGRNGSAKASSEEWIKYHNPDLILASTDKQELSSRLTKLFAQLGKSYTLTSTSATMQLVFTKDGCTMSSMTIATQEESFNSEEEAHEYAMNLRKKEIENHPFVGNRNTNLYYDHDNPIVDTIMDSYITYFNSSQQAEENGFTYAK